VSLSLTQCFPYFGNLRVADVTFEVNSIFQTEAKFNCRVNGTVLRIDRYSPEYVQPVVGQTTNLELPLPASSLKAKSLIHLPVVDFANTTSKPLTGIAPGFALKGAIVHISAVGHIQTLYGRIFHIDPEKNPEMYCGLEGVPIELKTKAPLKKMQAGNTATFDTLNVIFTRNTAVLVAEDPRGEEFIPGTKAYGDKCRQATRDVAHATLVFKS
jgi:hypothetical protein